MIERIPRTYPSLMSLLEALNEEDDPDNPLLLGEDGGIIGTLWTLDNLIEAIQFCHDHQDDPDIDVRKIEDEFCTSFGSEDGLLRVYRVDDDGNPISPPEYVEVVLKPNVFVNNTNGETN